jgi:molybdate transport system substrate-binding protein
MRRFLLFVLGLTLLGGACSSNEAGNEAVELTVFAASSLGDAFTEIGGAFEDANPGTSVAFNFGPSDGLAGQIQSEGTADVFASASGTWMDAVAEDPGVEERTDFVTNRLVIITPADNPAGVKSIEGLGSADLQLVLAAPGVPVGDYSREALEAAGILGDAEANVVSNEEDNAGVVAKIVAGEADAAIVYESDVSEAAGNDVTAIAIPDDVNVIATYPIATVVGAPHPDGAAAFVAFVTGPEGQAILERFGFGRPG